MSRAADAKNEIMMKMGRAVSAIVFPSGKKRGLSKQPQITQTPTVRGMIHRRTINAMAPRISNNMIVSPPRFVRAFSSRRHDLILRLSFHSRPDLCIQDWHHEVSRHFENLQATSPC